MNSKTTAKKYFTAMWISFAVMMGIMIGGEFLGISESSALGWVLLIIANVSFLILAVSMVATIFYWVARGQ